MSLDIYRAAEEIWNKAEVADAETYRAHLAAFIENFVQKDKRDRYRYYWLDKPHKRSNRKLDLDRDLDYTLCVKIKNATDIPATYQKKNGLYFDLHGEAKVLPVESAWNIGMLDMDAVYSLEAGKVAVFFYHEAERWLYRK